MPCVCTKLGRAVRRTFHLVQILFTRSLKAGQVMAINVGKDLHHSLVCVMFAICQELELVLEVVVELCTLIVLSVKLVKRRVLQCLLPFAIKHRSFGFDQLFAIKLVPAVEDRGSFVVDAGHLEGLADLAPDAGIATGRALVAQLDGNGPVRRYLRGCLGGACLRAFAFRGVILVSVFRKIAILQILKSEVDLVESVQVDLPLIVLILKVEALLDEV